MTIKYFTAGTTGAGVQWSVTAGNGVYVDAGVLVGSTDNFAVTGTGNSINVDIAGRLYGDLGGLALKAVTDSLITIGAGGEVGGDGMDAKGISLANVQSSSIENSGTIAGAFGVELSGLVDVQLENHGTISSAVAAINLQAGTTGSLTLHNYGQIEHQTLEVGLSPVYFSGGDTTDIIFNSGVINGVVDLGDGNDVFFGAASKAMNGGLAAYFQSIGASQFSGKTGVFVVAGDGKDQILGSKFADAMTGGKASDVLSGGAGDDRISGDGGKDGLFGGGGADTFVFNLLSDSKKKTADVIADFSRKQHDTLDLSGLDALPQTMEDDAFDFIGKDGFSGEAGEVRYVFDKQETVVLCNVDADKQAEFSIHLQGRIKLELEDFQL